MATAKNNISLLNLFVHKFVDEMAAILELFDFMVCCLETSSRRPLTETDEKLKSAGTDQWSKSGASCQLRRHTFLFLSLKNWFDCLVCVTHGRIKFFTVSFSFVPVENRR